MESNIIIRASAEDMRSFVARDVGVRYCEAIPGGCFKVRYRHAEGHRLTGTYTIDELEKTQKEWGR